MKTQRLAPALLLLSIGVTALRSVPPSSHNMANWVRGRTLLNSRVSARDGHSAHSLGKREVKSLCNTNDTLKALGRPFTAYDVHEIHDLVEGWEGLPATGVSGWPDIPPGGRNASQWGVIDTLYFCFYNTNLTAIVQLEGPLLAEAVLEAENITAPHAGTPNGRCCDDRLPTWYVLKLSCSQGDESWRSRT